jgi:hypothetical protein
MNNQRLYGFLSCLLAFNAGNWTGTACLGQAPEADQATTSPDRAAEAPPQSPPLLPEPPGDIATVDPEYWWTQPGAQVVTSSDFSRLWTAAEQVLTEFLFRIDRADFRAGILSSEPLISAQIFEPWRRDVQTGDDLARSSVATYRRTVRFEILRNDDDSYELTPKVLVERQAILERRITSVALYRSAFRRDRLARGSRAADQGIYIPSSYWFATGRDEALELALAQALRAKLGS